MQFQVPVSIKHLVPPVNYQDGILLTGSCFTEHIGNYLAEVKFSTLQNPNGILFDPLSVCRSLVSYIENKQYKAEDLFYYNEAWHSWHHHSRFSNPDAAACLQGINQSQNEAHQFLKNAGWLIVTLGSSFAYKLANNSTIDIGNGVVGEGIANCHKAPAQLFTKHLCTIEETVTALDGMLFRLFRFNPKLRIIFTISPVRHLRDGVVENNRSKARLLEAVHHVVNKFDKLYYFPSYELVVDVLRDYRFYDVDMAHPNYAATQFVLEHFFEYCVAPPAKKTADEIRKLVIAKNHKPFNANSQQHKKFLEVQLAKTQQLKLLHPYLNFKEELAYFGAGL